MVGSLLRRTKPMSMLLQVHPLSRSVFALRRVWFGSASLVLRSTRGLPEAHMNLVFFRLMSRREVCGPITVPFSLSLGIQAGESVTLFTSVFKNPCRSQSRSRRYLRSRWPEIGD